MLDSTSGGGLPGFIRRLFRRRDRLVFVTVKKPAKVLADERKKAETTAALRRVVAQGGAAQ